MKKTALPVLLLSQLFVFICACSSIECPVENRVRTIYHVYRGEKLDTLHDTLTIWTRTVKCKDTLLLNKRTNSSSFELPISYQHPEDTLYFCITDTTKVSTTDTVWIKKDDIPHFESVDCTPTFFHQLTGVRSTHHRIDTIVINHSQVDYESSTEHFHISLK